MNIPRSIALIGISALLLSGGANNLYASPGNAAPRQQHAQVNPAQPRVIIVQQNRQTYGQSSRSYGQQGRIQQYDYYPGLQYQQPRQYQQWPQQNSYGQQPRYDRHNNYGQPRNRWSQRPSQQQDNQYQRPDYRAQQQRYKAQRDHEREVRERNMDRMLRNARPQQYQQGPPRNQYPNYGRGIRR
ncbi:hypothetical protein [Halopseudomonas sabulinigri]|uniref:hypothetical protein n=1 Tax=Halopseudomonas sabulinigri TaxID=472181 RepID=UPI0012FD3122|nr:hypothetical protein [Halopseudomonas sabulinigri]